MHRDEGADAKLLEWAAGASRLKHTPHYVIAYDTDDATLRAFVSRVEATYKAVVGFAGTLGVSVKRPPAKLEILFFNEFASYRAYSSNLGFPASQHAPGFYSPENNRSAFFNYANADEFRKLRAEAAAARARSQQDGGKVNFEAIRARENTAQRQQARINRTVVQHEVAHQVLYNIGFHATPLANPRWLVEGLAMMFETPPSNGNAGIAAVNQMRLGDWREFQATAGMPSLRTLVSDCKVLLPGNPDAVKAYAGAWSLVFYLQQTRRRELAAYVQAVRQRGENRVYSPAEELFAFETAFGRLDDAFVVKYEQFLSRQRYSVAEAGR